MNTSPLTLEVKYYVFNTTNTHWIRTQSTSSTRAAHPRLTLSVPDQPAHLEDNQRRSSHGMQALLGLKTYKRTASVISASHLWP